MKHIRPQYMNAHFFFASVIAMIEKQEPFDALGFFYVDKTTFTAIISNTIAYIVILLQFK